MVMGEGFSQVDNDDDYVVMMVMRMIKDEQRVICFHANMVMMMMIPIMTTIIFSYPNIFLNSWETKGSRWRRM